MSYSEHKEEKRPSRKRKASYKGSKGYSKPRYTQYQSPSSGIALKGMDTDIDLGGANILSTVTTNGQMPPANLIQQGTGSYNRVGRRIAMKSIRVKGTLDCHMYKTAGGDNSGNIIRLVVVYDKQPTGVTPLFNQVFGVTDQNGTETSRFTDSLRYDNMERFEILKDDYFTFQASSMDQAVAGNYQAQMKHFDHYIKLKDRTTTFSGQTAPMAIADISSGAVYVIFRALINDALVSDCRVIHSQARLRYTD